jgi:myosin heavy subunit
VTGARAPLPRAPASATAMDDVTSIAQQLRSDDQELLQGLLHTLQSRHAAGLVFTRLGSMLIALNPLRTLPQFCSREERIRHLRAHERQLPPHIFEHGAPRR